MRFRNHFAKIDEALDERETISPKVRRWGALALLLIAIFIGWQEYPVERLFRRDVVMTLRPDLLSGLFAVLLVTALYVRRLVAFRGTIYCLVTFILNVTIVAILVRALLGTDASWIGKRVAPYFFGFAVTLAWTGIREFAQISWFIAVFFGVLNLVSVNNAMGTDGFFFVLSASLGVLAQIDFKYDSERLRKEFTGSSSSFSDRKYRRYADRKGMSPGLDERRERFG